MLPVDLSSPLQVQLDLAGRVRARRKERGWSRGELARRAGVAMETLKLFERTGKIALTRLVLVASALGCLDEFEALFKAPPATSLAELERRAGLKRGRRLR